MRTNIVLNDALTNEAFELTGAKTKRELVEMALRELVRTKRQSTSNGLCKAFEALRKLTQDEDPLPAPRRRDRANPFADR